MTSQPSLAIEATGLVKAFGETRAVDGVDLAVRSGSVYGVLGPNGAGKTTAIRMLATLLRPDAGSARVLGYDIVEEADAVRRAVSLTGQLASVDEDLTGRENLILIARLLGLKRAAAKDRAAELLEAFGLAEAAARLVKHYSGGMRRRLDIAASIVVTPELMFLDEPTTGLDPRSRNQVWDIIRLLVAGGTTILLCTQYLEEADQLADGIAVIDRGKVIAEGTPGQLKASVGTGALHVRLVDPEQRSQAEQVLARELGGAHEAGQPTSVPNADGAASHSASLPNADEAAGQPTSVPNADGAASHSASLPNADGAASHSASLPNASGDPAALSVQCSDADRAAEAVAALTRAGVRIADFSLGRPSLDEVFLALTGHPAEVDPAAERPDAIEEEQTA